MLDNSYRRQEKRKKRVCSESEATNRRSRSASSERTGRIDEKGYCVRGSPSPFTTIVAPGGALICIRCSSPRKL